MKKILVSFAALCCVLTMRAEAPAADVMNPLITSMPSLSIAPDARAAGLGDIGVVTEADFLLPGQEKKNALGLWARKKASEHLNKSMNCIS